MLKLIFIKKYKEYISRKSKLRVDRTIKLVFYEVYGSVVRLKMKSNKVGLYEIVTWLPFQELYEPYKEPIKVNLVFLGYEGLKQIKNMTFKEFLKERKIWKKLGDIK